MRGEIGIPPLGSMAGKTLTVAAIVTVTVCHRFSPSHLLSGS
jgi:hypothetical protein